MSKLEELTARRNALNAEFIHHRKMLFDVNAGFTHNVFELLVHTLREYYLPQIDRLDDMIAVAREYEGKS